MDLKGLLDCSPDIVLRRLLLEIDVHRESPTRDFEDRHPSEKLTELLSIHRSRSYDNANIPSPLSHLLQNPKKHISVERTLMSLVHHNNTVLFQIRILKRFSKENTISHVFNQRILAGEVFKSNSVPDQSA